MPGILEAEEEVGTSRSAKMMSKVRSASSASCGPCGQAARSSRSAVSTKWKESRIATFVSTHIVSHSSAARFSAEIPVISAGIPPYETAIPAMPALYKEVSPRMKGLLCANGRIKSGMPFAPRRKENMHSATFRCA